MHFNAQAAITPVDGIGYSLDFAVYLIVYKHDSSQKSMAIAEYTDTSCVFI